MTAQLESVQGESVQEPESAPQRGTQSFLMTIAMCWRRPSLLGLELLWRWGVGIPILALLYWEGTRILASVSLVHTGIDQFSLIDTVGAAQILSSVAAALLPRIREIAWWLLPILAVVWAVASGLGRSLVLHRYDRTLRLAPWLMAGLQLLRIVMLGASFALWFVCLHWAAWSSLSGAEPDLVGYFVKAIFLSMIVFFFWAVVSWVFSIAPLLVLLEGTGMVASLRASVRFGHGSLRGMRSKLVEINLILDVLKVILVMLSMVFCVTPAPFKEHITGMSLYAWWGFVTVCYLVASDFFQVARVISFIELWRAVNQPLAVNAAPGVSG